MWIWVFWGLIGGLMLIGVVGTIREKLTGSAARRGPTGGEGYTGDGSDGDIERGRAHGAAFKDWSGGGFS